VILILASAADKAARQFAGNYEDVNIFTCQDMAMHKLALRFPDIYQSTISVRGMSIPVYEIEGIINGLPFILPDELFFFPRSERQYQAAEFFALINFFASSSQYPVINPSSKLSMSGLFFSPFYWYDQAYQLGIPVCKYDIDTRRKKLSDGQQAEFSEAVYFNGEIFGSNKSVARSHTKRLAEHIGLHYLKGFFHHSSSGQIQFVRARTIPDFLDPIIGEAFIHFIKSHKRHHDIVMGHKAG
jgi:hypothetical protein